MTNLRFWRSPRLRKLLRVDSDLAEAEGLAAGTGLLTGELAEHRTTVETPCPRCGGASEVIAVDLIVREASRRCRDCALTWNQPEPRIVRSAS